MALTTNDSAAYDSGMISGSIRAAKISGPGPKTTPFQGVAIAGLHPGTTPYTPAAIAGRFCAVLFFLALFLTPPFFVSAEMEQERSTGFDLAYYPGNQQGYDLDDGAFAPISYQVVDPPDGDDDGLRSLGTTWGGVEAKLYYVHSWIVPALRWSDGPLARDNSIVFRSTTGVSPISATQELQVTVTPIALMQLSGGVFFGTGWNIRLFDGLGTVDTETGDVDAGSFQGAVVRAYGSATLQFDFAAVVPGEWNHVVMLVSPKWTYGALTSAEPDQPWMFEADGGTNYNGWTFDATAFLGHQPPWKRVSTMGFLYETGFRVGKSVDRARESAPEDFDPAFRGDKLGALVNLELGAEQRNSLTILAQVHRSRLASDETIFNAGAQRRETVGAYWSFFRVAFQYRLQLD